MESLRLGGKPLTIRAAAGFTPILIATNNAQPLILVDAPLALEGLTFWRRAARLNTSLIASVEAAPLHLLNCRILRSRFAGQEIVGHGQLRPAALGDPLRYRTLLGFQHGSTDFC